MLHTNAMMACKTFNAESDQHHLGEIRHDGTVRGRVVITMPCHAIGSRWQCLWQPLHFVWLLD